MVESVEALRALARQGLYVEPIVAVAAAGLSWLLASGVIRPQEYSVLMLNRWASPEKIDTGAVPK